MVVFFFENVWYFRVFKFSILTANNAKYFFHLNHLRDRKDFDILWSLFSYSLGENKFVWYSKLLPSNIKSINPIEKYLRTIDYLKDELTSKILTSSKCLITPCLLEQTNRATSLPVTRFPDKLAPNVPRNILRNPPF